MGEKNFFGTFEEAKERLRRDIPLAFPVTVRRAKADDGTAGTCSFNRKARRFTIHVCMELSQDAAVLVLIHEWAHALDWNEKGPVKKIPHSKSWGECYARILRIFDKVD